MYKNLAKGIIVVMAFSLFLSCAKKSPEVRFWSWFEKNQYMLFHFERDQERVFERLAAAMKKVNPNLTFEFSMIRNGKREFVISADGIKEAFPAVELLYASAPELPRWTFIKFRPRRKPVTMEMRGLKIEPSDIEISIVVDREKAGLTVFMKGLDESRREPFEHIAYIILDHAIGEYDMETKVGFIRIRSFEQESQSARYSLEEFPLKFDEFFL